MLTQESSGMRWRYCLTTEVARQMMQEMKSTSSDLMNKSLMDIWA
jgi:hypothetical protein